MVIMCQECGVMPCKRGAIKYCSVACSLKNTSVLKMYGNFWKGKRMSDEVRLKISNATKGRLANIGSFQKGSKINLGRKRLDVGEKSACWKSRVGRPCSYCKKLLLLVPHQIKNRERNFCNRKCWALGTRGKGSPVYKGEKAISRLRGRIAQMPEYKEWHAFILKRDNYQCVLCQSKKQLEVDHIKRFLFIANENKIFTLEDARKCTELWDTKNGRTLCRPCHRTSDTYGTKGTSKTY